MRRFPLAIKTGSILLVAVLAASGMPRICAKEAEPIVREIFVPFEDLDVILEATGRRVFLTRAEYETLRDQAQQQADDPAPHKTALLRADYDATVEDGRVRIEGRIVIDVLADGLQAVPLELSGVGLRRARLDDEPAALSRPRDGMAMLFVQGKGRHTLFVDAVAPVEVAAARQTIHYLLPTGAAGRTRLTVPGDVELRSGAQVLSRMVDAAAEVTRMELMTGRGKTTLEMTLNNRLAAKQRVMIARSVVVDELTETYERLHVTTSLKIVHGSAQQVRFALPAGFEVTDVTSPLLSRWAVQQDGDSRVLEVFLRNAEKDLVVLNLSAQRSPAVLTGWTMPQIRPLDVAGSVSIVGLLVEERLELQSLEPSGLITVDTETLTETLPSSVFEAEPGAPTIRPVAAFYAPRADFRLAGDVIKPARRIQAISNTLLIVQDSQLEVRGGFALLPIAERLFDCDFSLDAGWDVTEVTSEDGKPLAFERYAEGNATARIHVTLPAGVPPGQAAHVHFHAVNVPDGWLGQWPSRELRFPQFSVIDATEDRGAIAVAVNDDLVARIESSEGLTPLDENKKADFNLADVPTSLAFRFDSRPFDANLRIERTEPRITAETYSFLTVEPGNVRAHYEIIYEVGAARTRTLALRLPTTTPAEVAIRGLDEVAIKESVSEETADGRRWTVELARPARGTVRLEVTFQQRLEMESTEANGDDRQLAERLALPIVLADGVEYQTGALAVEGSDELEIHLDTQARRADIGQLADAEYVPGRHLLAAFGFTGTPPEVTANVVRPIGYAVPAAIVQRAELVTSVSASGVSQSVGRFLLVAKAQFVEILLPADSTLWSVHLDGTPAKPQRDGDRVLVSLPSVDEQSLRDLQLVYETPVHGLGVWGALELPAPKLLLRSSDKSPSRELPVADLAWYLQLPPGYRLADSTGTVYPNLDDPTTHLQLAGRTTPVETLYRALVVNPGWGAVGGVTMMARSRMATTSESATFGLDPSSDVAPYDTAEAFEGAAHKSSEILGLGRELDGDDESPPAEQAALDEMFGEPTDSPVDRFSDSLMNGLEAESEIAAAAEPESAPAKPAGTTSGRQASRGISAGKFWAMGGLRSLKIDLAEQDERLVFASLGADPVLAVTLVDGRRLDMLAWGVAFVVVLIGLLLINRTIGARLRYIVLVLVLASLMPLLTGWDGEIAMAFDLAFYAGLALIPVYLLFSFLRWIASIRVSKPLSQAAMVLVSFGLAVATPAMVIAAPPEARLGPLTIKIEGPDKPVTVPQDAVIFPYDPSQSAESREPNRIIVPYEKYVELWNLAHPDKTLEAAAPPSEYALAGAQWRATLTDGDSLVIEGRLRVDVYVDHPLTIPLSLSDGVLTRAQLDGQPAQIRVVEPDAPQPQQVPQQAAQARVEQISGLVALYVAGKGRKELDLAVSYRLTRRGGWRVAEGRIPTAPATGLTLTVPREQTELRLAGVSDRASYDTLTAAESIETALLPGGDFRIEWRPKVAQATVDRSLTVDSDAVLDVQEDGVRLVWRLSLKFPLSERDYFSLNVPSDYLVEQVVGENVRGWEAVNGRVNVTLLKAVRDEQQLTVHLARRGTEGEADSATLAAPSIQVPDAALHEGRITVRRSPLLELRIVRTEGLARTALSSESPDAGQVDSPLGIRPFQAFRFARIPFVLDISVTPIQARMTVEIQTLLRMAELERTLESRVVCRAERRPVYRVQLQLPSDLYVAEVIAPGQPEWAVTDTEQGRRLSVLLNKGQSGEFSVIVRGMLGRRQAAASVPLPRIVADNVSRQQSTIVLQTDPSYDARFQQLQGCQTVLLRRAYGWLAAEQRTLARAAVHCPSAEFSGQVLLVRRTPRIACQTVSNLRVTNRNFEETILLDFNIQDAGIREVMFLLPAGMRDARISAPMMRQKSVEDTDSSMVRVRVELQDEVMGQFRVLIENDRLLSSDPQPVPIPVVETGRTLRRFVALESAGQDEVLVDDQDGLEPLSREQTQWRTLAEMLGEGITQAFLLQPGNDNPRLVVRTQDREAVETVGARIALAQTVLTIDTNGAYRGLQTYQVDNRTEQFLEVKLPRDAALWTTRVAGQPVKPVAGNSGVVRIPLVKTAEGDEDYPVELKYGGRMEPIAGWAKVDFPLMRTVNINVEESQVRLWLPETHRWLDFGGSMRQVAGEDDLTVGYVKYKKEQLRRMTANAASANPYARLRARQNIGKLASELTQVEQSSQRTANKRLREEIDSSYATVQRAAELLDEQDQAQLNGAPVPDNRDRLNYYFEQQSNGFSRNIVNQQGGNFAGIVVEDSSRGSNEAQTDASVSGQIQQDWIDANRLTNDSKANVADMQQEGVDEGRKQRVQIGERAGGQISSNQLRFAPDVTRAKGKEALLKDMEEQSVRESQRDESSRLRRYQQRLEERNQPAQPPQMQSYGRAVNGIAPGVDAAFRRRGEADHSLELHLGDDLRTALPLAETGDGAIVPDQGLVQGPGDAGVDASLRFELAGQAQATGLASLDVQLPRRGVLYRFTTPRGDIEIEARVVNVTLLNRLIRLAWVLGLVVVIGGLYRWSRDRDLNDFVGRVTATLLVLVGIVFLVLGLFPVLALAAIALGIVQHVRLFSVRPAASPAGA